MSAWFWLRAFLTGRLRTELVIARRLADLKRETMLRRRYAFKDWTPPLDPSAQAEVLRDVLKQARRTG